MSTFLLYIQNANSSGICTTLGTVGSEVGYTLTEGMKSIWTNDGAANSIITKYGDNFTSQLTTVNQVLSSIQKNVAAMAAASDVNAEETENATTSPTTTTKPTPTPIPSPTPTPEKTISVGGKINAGSAAIYDYVGDTSGEHQYFSDDPVYTVFGEDKGYLKVRWHKLSSGVTGWFKKSDVKAYKTGGLVDYTGLAQVDGTPGKPEIMLNAEDSKNFIGLRDTLRNMAAGSLSIENKYKLSPISQISGIIDIDKKIASIKEKPTQLDTSISFGDIHILIDHVEDYNDFVNQLKNDNRFEKMIQSMTIDRLAGGSPLAKNKFKW